MAETLHDTPVAAGGRGPRPVGEAAAVDTKRLTIDIPKDLHRILKVQAAERDLTMAGLVRSLIAAWVDSERRRAAR